MKKFYLMAASLLVALGASANSLTFETENQKFVNGETFTLDYSDEVTYYDDTQDYDIVADPKINLTCDYPTGQLEVTAVCTSGQEIQLCFGGTCNMGKEITKLSMEDSYPAGTSIPLQFEYMGFGVTELPEVVTLLSAQDLNDPSTATSMTVIMTAGSNSIKAITTDNYLSVANGVLTFTSANEAALNVYSLSGNRVMSANVKGAGTLSTASLAPGIYVYSLGNKTGKFVVR
ncbi:MAG: T9SS type A sorting domain-containing protein [Bacteroidales bacterium]|nr:T9SS type A sorting domain-containing protein [Bacteroidales bacterium]MBD5377676.1 T9SS type A sorting domain-containing protein [Bacteroides sp.]